MHFNTSNTDLIIGKKTWSYQSLADEDSSKCCICKEDIASLDFCHKCHNAVHALVPCSTEDERGIRLCNFCCDYSVGSQDVDEAYLCLGCSELLEMTIWTKSGKRQGCFYYRCRAGETPKCKTTFDFWAPGEYP
ncbi:uncharacterized protein LOC127748679 [Frankliniella occidentalis]|uniref:Uncharacterized protein LOC127748679 n=1 Tax=Frankliniella occidentalis TaxID=133901 RepID=A0A9C6U1E5_FRAOC|nr:uncharacterized protein LOC127748679 [Frankliniella occidentalis]